MKVRHVAYRLPDELTGTAVISELTSLYKMREGAATSVREQFLDTFDWSLYRKGYLLRRTQGRYVLMHLDGKAITEIHGTRKKNPFWWDFEESDFQQRLSRLSDIRALLPFLTYKKKYQDYSLLNKDRKTVLNVTIEWGDVEREEEAPVPVASVLHMGEVRGYEKPFDKTASFLNNEGLKVISAEEIMLPRLLQRSQLEVPNYTSKFSVSMGKDYRVHEAVSTICLTLLAAMKRNLQGVLDDVDSEFLHDFRIAVRRTRSLITQLKKVLPDEVVRHFNAQFKHLGSITGPVRDLDVYLLKKDEYRAMLPKQLHEGLELFFENLSHIRRSELRAMRRALSAEDIQRLFRRWESFHTSAPTESWRGADKKCLTVARKVISKRYNRILHDGSQIEGDTPDEALHQLRIQGKKLRYLMEFFRPFFDEESVEACLKQMKRLQNNLGDFNDLSVQQDMLTDYQEALSGRNKKTLKVAAALGGLISHLNDEQRKVRKKFERTFSTFTSEETRLLFEQTFMFDKD